MSVLRPEPSIFSIELDAIAAPAGILGELAEIARRHPGEHRLVARIANASIGRDGRLSLSFGDGLRVDPVGFRVALAARPEVGNYAIPTLDE